jgi:hypothetical protein
MAEHLIQFAADAISAYFDAHPDAADTTEGIHLWWIAWPGIAESIHITAAALVRLEQAGLVERYPVGTREIWRKPRARDTSTI